MSYALYKRVGKAGRRYRRGVGAPARSPDGEPIQVIAASAANRRLVKKLLVVIALAFGFGFALVPLYDSFCRLTGINGKTAASPVSQARAAALSTPSQVDRERTVTVEFTDTVMPGLPWEVHPVISHLDLHPGEIQQARFVVHNRSQQTLVGQAVPSISPGQAAAHFNKLECFCFRQQGLAPGETKELPLVFIVDPALDRDVHTITLAYAFFPASESRP
ncbi:MAG: cytochrome c oxidase assembly protein [Betaproteobacteria bacterium]|nr:cytochrome c oxidase assembly protein [Betaproteobacteria bacterium]